MSEWSDLTRGPGLAIVVSGPSGVGKDSVLEVLCRIHPQARRCVTATTREPREGEVDGVDYVFLCVDEFKQRVESGWFLEYAEVHGNFYGTPRGWVEERTALGEDVILKIDVQGGLEVKRRMPDVVMVFLVPPSLDELERRLRSRSTDSDDEIGVRLANARRELEHITHYDYVVENDTVAAAAERLKAVIVAEQCRVR